MVYMTLQSYISIFIYENGKPNAILDGPTIHCDRILELFKRIKVKFSDEIIISYFDSISPRMVYSLDLIITQQLTNQYTIRSLWNNKFCLVTTDTRRIEWFI